MMQFVINLKIVEKHFDFIIFTEFFDIKKLMVCWYLNEWCT